MATEPTDNLARVVVWTCALVANPYSFVGRLFLANGRSAMRVWLARLPLWLQLHWGGLLGTKQIQPFLQFLQFAIYFFRLAWIAPTATTIDMWTAWVCMRAIFVPILIARMPSKGHASRPVMRCKPLLCSSQHN